jgi:hypothetical protein
MVRAADLASGSGTLLFSEFHANAIGQPDFAECGCDQAIALEIQG